MNKTELIDSMAAKTGLTKKNAEAALNAFVETVSEELTKGEKVSLVGFGTFGAKKREARTGRNPQTGEAVKIDARVVPSFKAGSKLKEALN